jgi:hypothetical protein
MFLCRSHKSFGTSSALAVTSPQRAFGKGDLQMKKTILSALSVAAVALSAATAQAEAPSWVTIRSVSYAGSGCPAGSVAENVAPDLTALTLLFDSYIAEAGPGVPFREKRKNCQINIDLNFPQGWSFTLFKADYRGYAALERGTTGEQVSTYYFQGDSSQTSLKSKFYGARDGDYLITDELLLAAQIWSPCGAKRSLNINTQVRVDNARNQHASALLTVDSVDATLKHVYGIKWKRCR